MILSIYVVVFSLVSVASVVASAREGEPRWVVAVELVCSALAASGLVVYWQDWRQPVFEAIWQGVAPAIVVGYAALLIHDLPWIRKEADDPELTPTENRWLLIVGLLLGAVVVLPALWLNLVLAFGR